MTDKKLCKKVVVQKQTQKPREDKGRPGMRQLQTRECLGPLELQEAKDPLAPGHSGSINLLTL